MMLAPLSTNLMAPKSARSLGIMSGYCRAVREVVQEAVHEAVHYVLVCLHGVGWAGAAGC